MKITSSKAALKTNNIQAAEDTDDAVVEPEDVGFMFDAEDVADLVSEVTGEEVEIAVEDDAVTFTVGEDEYTVEPDEGAEVMEMTRVPAKKTAVAANTATKKTAVRASTDRSRVVRRIKK